MNYADRLNRSRADFPFSEWKTSLAPRLTTMPAFCDRAKKILSDLIDELIRLGEAAPEAEKIGLFKTAVEALNVLNYEDGIIETTAREELCELFWGIAVNAGIDPSKYGNGEGPASEWRDW